MTWCENSALGIVRHTRQAATSIKIMFLEDKKPFKSIVKVVTILFQLMCMVSIQFQTKLGEKVPFFLQIVLPVKIFFTGTSGKHVFTGKSGLPEQRFTTLIAKVFPQWPF